MTTTSSTGSTPSAASQILTSLNTGSGIDTGSLVTSLVEAQYAFKRDQITARNDTLTAQISDAATLLSGITGFASSLQTIVKSGALSTQPTTSDSSTIAVSTIAGAELDDFSAVMKVAQLATGQSAAAAYVADRTATLGTGTLTLTFGTATVADGAMTGFTAGGGTPVDIAIDADHASLDGIADAINAAKAGVTASIITDSQGARLMLKSATGAEQAFTLTAAAGSDAALSQLDIGVGTVGTTIGIAAQDAILSLDGVTVTRATNSISDLIEGVTLDLLAAAPEKTVTIATTKPRDSLTQVVADFVDTFNQLQAIGKADIDPITGSLARDSAARTMMTALSRLTLTKLTTGGAPGMPSTLAEIGVGTTRDGTLKLDTDTLAKAIADHPEAVEAMFAEGTASTGDGLMAALNAISKQANDKTYGLAASQASYAEAQEDLADQETKIDDQAEMMTKRLTQQFASMDARVAAYKSTQTFLQSQIDAWNKKD